MNLYQQICNARSVKNKIALFYQNDNFVKAFEYTYNIYYNYGVKFSTREIDSSTIQEPNETLFQILDKLRKRELVGNQARKVIEIYSKHYGDLIKLICNKNLRCGIQAKTLNKHFGKGFVPEFNVQLAKESNDIAYPIFGEIKYDGVRVIIIIKNKKPRFFTRNGKEFLLTKIYNDIKGVCEHYNIDNFILDGELIHLNGKNKYRTVISGKVTSLLSGKTVNETGIRYKVFDTLTTDEFENSKCFNRFTFRRRVLRNFLSLFRTLRITESQYRSIGNKADQTELYKKLTNQGFEGLILKTNSTYNFKRDNTWIKLKDTLTADLKCVDIIEGEGKFVGQIGALVCEGTLNGKRINVKVGSGLTDFDRSLAKESYIGKTIEIKYNSVIDNSLFLPRFVCIRYDK